mmetsp:Transcript_97936/g.310605  ORF Transcript_97936/g.310605 Transcript_97936/m.310605 type:complete len:535 (-) Transcript_97936:55-1659(-)
MRRAWLLPVLLRASVPRGALCSMCPGVVAFEGYSDIALTNTGHSSGQSKDPDVFLSGDGVTVPMDARAYFADSCSDGTYGNGRYSALNFKGKVMRFTVDLSGAGCGCNAAVYLVSMKQNSRVSSCGDYYCDANEVCGVYCSEIDIMEANRHAFHSTLHSSHDRTGQTDGYGGGGKDGDGNWTWSGPRTFGKSAFGPAGECVDTAQPFMVEANFPTDASGELEAMGVRLSQQGKPCTADLKISGYKGMAQLSEALHLGMTPVISYWKSKKMLWLDGEGADAMGPCSSDTEDCGPSVHISGFSVADMFPGAPAPAPAPAPSTSRSPAPAISPIKSGDNTEWSHCAWPGQNCRASSCCLTPGFQCYERDFFWAECRESCSNVGLSWSCLKLGKRAASPWVGSPVVPVSTTMQLESSQVPPLLGIPMNFMDPIPWILVLAVLGLPAAALWRYTMQVRNQLANSEDSDAEGGLLSTLGSFIARDTMDEQDEDPREIVAEDERSCQAGRITGFLTGILSCSNGREREEALPVKSTRRSCA